MVQIQDLIPWSSQNVQFSFKFLMLLLVKEYKPSLNRNTKIIKFNY